MAGGIGLGLSLGGAAMGGVEGLREVLRRQFLASVEQRIAEDQDLDRQQNQSQFDAMMPLRERGIAVGEGNLGLRGREFDATRGDITSANEAAKAQQVELDRIIALLPPEQQNLARMQLFKIDPAKLRPATPDQPQGFTLSPGQVRFGPDGKRIAGVDERPKPDPNAPNPVADQNKLDEVDQAMTTIDTLENHPGIYAAVGFKGPSNYLSGTNAADFNAYFDALKSQLTFPNLQKMRGLGAMSNIEFSTLQKAATALDRSMTEQTFRKELTNIKTNLERIKDRIKRGVKVDPATGKELTTLPLGPGKGANFNLPDAAAALGIERVR